MKLTVSQQSKIDYIKNEFRKHLFDEDYEIKECTIEQLGDTDLIDLYMVSGLKGDEGTMASVFARDSIHCFISPRGKVTYCDVNKNFKIKVFNCYKQSIYTLIIANR